MIVILARGLYYELCVIKRHHAQWAHAFLFFIVFLSLFGIALGKEPLFLKALTPALVWIAFLLTAVLTVDILFRTDYEEGHLEQWLLSPCPLWWLLLIKSVAGWLASCVPLFFIVPFISMSLGLSGKEILLLELSLLVGSPALVFIGVLGAALTTGLKCSGLFLGLLLLPLYVPILLLGESTVVSLSISQWPIFQLSLLAAFSVLAITFLPYASARALKIAMDV